MIIAEFGTGRKIGTRPFKHSFMGTKGIPGVKLYTDNVNVYPIVEGNDIAGCDLYDIGSTLIDSLYKESEVMLLKKTTIPVIGSPTTIYFLSYEDTHKVYKTVPLNDYVSVVSGLMKG